MTNRTYKLATQQKLNSITKAEAIIYKLETLNLAIFAPHGGSKDSRISYVGLQAQFFGNLYAFKDAGEGRF